MAGKLYEHLIRHPFLSQKKFFAPLRLCARHFWLRHAPLAYELAGVKITLKNVRASVCSKCGQSFISGRVAEDVNRLVNRITEDINSFVRTQPQVSEGSKEVAIAV